MSLDSSTRRQIANGTFTASASFYRYLDYLPITAVTTAVIATGRGNVRPFYRRPSVRRRFNRMGKHIGKHLCKFPFLGRVASLSFFCIGLAFALYLTPFLSIGFSSVFFCPIV